MFSRKKGMRQRYAGTATVPRTSSPARSAAKSSTTCPYSSPPLAALDPAADDRQPLAGVRSGTTSLDGATLVGMARNLVKSFLNQGARNLVFINGHFENYQFLYEGIDLALEELGIGPGAEQSVLLLSYWDFVSQDTLTQVYPGGFPGWDIEHGGVLETSLMLHLEPARVALDRLVDGPAAVLPRFDRLPVVPERTPATGCLSSAAGSSAAKGGLLYGQVVDDLSADLASELAREP